MRTRALLVTIILATATAAVRAENWPQWRGPSLNGVSTEKNLPVEWSTEENVTWKLELPEWSGSTPIIWGDRIFLNVAAGDGLYLWCVNRNTADPLWVRPLGSGNVKMRKQNMSSPSPVTDGKNVYVMTGTGSLKGYDFNGNQIWARDIQKDYGRFGLNWGYASSPLLFEDSLYVQVLHGMRTDDPSYILRIDKKTGKTLWRVERLTDAIRESPDSYSTPALLRYDGKTEIVITGGDCATGHDAATGKELWRLNGLNPRNDPYYRTIASPLVAGGLIYASSRVRPLVAIRTGGRGDITESHRVWSTNNGPDVPTPVTDGKYFYIVNDKGITWCLNANTGETIWGPERIEMGIYSSSPVLADGKIYITSEDGITTVMKAGPNFEILARNNLDDYSLSSVAISDGQLFLRTAQHLYCIGKRQSR
jgi:outer membrane protein assembly factor BamB